MKLIPQEQVQQTAQILLAFLDSDGASVPGSMLEGVLSGKSMLRGILGGQLGVVQLDMKTEPPADDPPADDPPPATKTPAKKKVAKKKASKKRVKKAA